MDEKYNRRGKVHFVCTLKVMDLEYIVPYIGKGSTFDEKEMEVIREILMNDKTMSCAEYRRVFEEDFAKFVGVEYAFALTNCTVALEFASYLAGIQTGDEVISTCFSYQATILPLLQRGVKIKFCDIEPNGLGVDLNEFRKLISPKTKAVFVTHYGGMIVKNIEEIVRVSHDNNAIVIEDCAHAIGSSYEGKKAGSFGDFGCFSFHSLKNISTLGQGGMITLHNKKWADVIRKIRGTEPDAVFYDADVKFGMNKVPHDDIERHAKNAYIQNCSLIKYSGTNATLSEPSCAVGSIQLEKVGSFNSRRREIAIRLTNGLSRIPQIRIQETTDQDYHIYHLYTFFLRDEAQIDRDEFVRRLKMKGIEIILRYFPLHLLPEWRFQGGGFGLCPVAERVWFKEIVNLPIYPKLTNNQVDYMIETIKDVIYEMVCEVK